MVQKFDSLRAKCFLQGYISRVIRVYDVNTYQYQITTYQGDHSDEYLVSEMKNDEVSGRSQLFCKGVLQMSWTIDNGHRVGGVTVYENGKVTEWWSWSSFDGGSLKAIQNTKYGLQMAIINPSNGVAVYRGGYNSEMEREGRGCECDSESGRVLSNGKYVKDELIRVIQEFESENRMIEYAGGDENNTDVMSRRPIYVGGYIYDEKACMYVRNGDGVEINVDSGIGSRESVWVNGMEDDDKGSELIEGWYVKNEMMAESMRIGLTEMMVDGGKMEVKNKNNLYSIPFNVSGLTVSDSCCNEDSVVEFDLRRFSHLQSIKIGSGSFVNVKRMDMSGLNLSEVVIGENSLRCLNEFNIDRIDAVKSDLHIIVMNSNHLRVLSPAVTNVTIADNCFYGLEVRYLNLSDFSRLKSIVTGSNSLNSVRKVNVGGLKNLREFKVGVNSLRKLEEFVIDSPSVISGRLQMTISTIESVKHLKDTLREIVFVENSYNQSGFREMDLSVFVNVEVIEMKKNCMKKVRSLNLNGLSKLKTIKVGLGSLMNLHKYGIIAEMIK